MSYRRTHNLHRRALGGVCAALVVVSGAVAVSVSNDAPTSVRLTQNATETDGASIELGQSVMVNLKPLVAEATGGVVPPGASLQITGLPDGLVQDDWTISGTPTRTGVYDVQLTVTAGGITESRTIVMTVVDEAAQDQSVEPDTGDGQVDQAPDAQGPTGTDGDTEGGADEDGQSEDGQSEDSQSEDGQSEDDQSGDDNDADAGTPEVEVPEAEDDDSTDDSESTPTPVPPVSSSDLCDSFAGGQLDGASLALTIGPLLGLDDSNPLITSLVGAIVQMLPSVLGIDSGSLGTLACSPLAGTGSSALAGSSGDVDVPDADADDSDLDADDDSDDETGDAEAGEESANSDDMVLELLLDLIESVTGS